jgi:5-methylcytosine-specific restriction endonuclease McrA
MGKSYEQKVTRRRQVGLAQKVAQKLRVSRRNSVLFHAVAQALGREWAQGSRCRIRGYELVEEYAVREGIVHQPSRKTKSRRVYDRAASNAFLESFEWRRLRMEVIKKRGARCECCGATPADGQTVINVDHVKPRKLFPELALEESNLQVLCGVCNHGKGNWDQTDWRALA